MNIEEEIRELLQDKAVAFCTDLSKEEEKELTRALTDLFKAYARELVPEEKEIENAYPYFGFDEGYNACREEILRRIEDE